MKKILKNIALFIGLILFSINLIAADSTFGTTSLALTDQTGCSTTTYTFTQTLGNSGDFQINVGHNVTITFPAGTDASTFTGGTFDGGTISGETATATQITFTAPAQVKKNNTFTIILNGITNGDNLSGNCTVSTDNATSGTNSATYAFTTNACPCAAANVPYTQDFESVSTPSIPTCNSIENAGSGNDWVTDNNPGYGFTTNTLTYDYNSSNAADAWYFTQGINLSSGTNYTIIFDYGGTGATFTEKMAVYYGSSAASGSMSNSLFDNSSINNSTPITESIDFTPSSTGVFYFGFNCYSDVNEWHLYVDNISIIAAATCITPSSLAAGSITATQASLSWTENGSATQWDIEFGLAGFSPTGTPTQTSVANPYTQTGLSASTAYDYYVRADCGGSDYSTWVGPYNFTTPCGLISVFPWTETFETTSGSLPCWSVNNNNADTDEWEIQTSSSYANTGDQSYQIYTDFNSGSNDDYLISPGIVLTGNEEMIFYQRVRSSSEPNDFEILLSTTGTAPANFTTTLLANASYSNTTYIEYTINLSAYSGTIYISFHVPNGGLDGYYLYIDDVTIQTLPTCPDPTSLTAGSITTTQTSLSWTENGSATQWDIEFGLAGFSPTGTPTQTSVANPYTQTGLSASTAYDYYVRADCGGSDYSTWVGPYSFTTPCGSISVFPWTETFETTSGSLPCWSVNDNNSDTDEWEIQTSSLYANTGDQSYEIYTDFNSGSNDDYLISPGIVLTGNEEMIFYQRVRSSSEPNDFEVLLSTTGTAPANFTTTLLASASYSNTTYIEYTINLSAYSGTVNIAFHVPNGGLDGYYLYIDDVTIQTIPTCPKPITLTASNILPDQVDLSWTENGSATQWDIELGTNGFSPTGTPTQSTVTNPYTYTGLTGVTSYDYYVRADCGGADLSIWSGPYNFTTADPYMVYTSSAVTQTVINAVPPGAIGQQTIGVQIVTTNPTSPLDITSFVFSTNGSTSAGTDIVNAKLYYTGTSSSFAATTQFGSTSANPTGGFTITGTQALAEGTNYFWLTYDINSGATLNNFVDAECSQITVDGSDENPSTPAPAGDREILDIYLISDITVASTCTGTFLDSGGDTGDYGNSELYAKTFTAGTPGSALEFTFTSFATESSNDELYIYDGPNDSYPQIAGSPFSGTTSPGTITSSGAEFTFKFDSDGSILNTGWEATINCVPITAPVCPTLNTPADTEIDVCPGSVMLNWTEGTTGFATEGYKLYFGTNSPPDNIINGTDLSNVTSYELTNLAANTTFYWKAVPYNTAGDNTACSEYSFTSLNLGITSTNSPITTCLNTATLTATGNGTITWYDVPTGGSPIATGGSYAATFSGNTTYYVATEAGGGGSEFGGDLSTTGTDGSFITSSLWGIVFDATDDITIVSTTIYPTGTGTVDLAILNDAGTEIASTGTVNVTGTGVATPVVVPLGFNISTGTNYKIVLKSYTGITNLVRDFSSSFPYPSPSGAIDVTSGWSGSTTTAYYWFYNIEVSSGCVSAREAVVVNHTADPITITPDGPTIFLDGNSVGLAASSTETPAYTYTWSPATGLSATTGANVTASPNTTTTYTVTGSNGSCANSEDITITVTYPCTGLGTGHTAIASLPFNETSTTCGAVDDITSSNATVCSSTSYYTGEDVVYSFTPTSTGQVTIDLTSTGTSTGLMLYDDCPMSGQGGTCVAYAQSSSGNESICVGLEQDITYYLVVDSYDAPDCNPYTINISAPDPNGVANDLPCNATAISIGGLQSGDLACTSGTSEPGAATCWTTGNLNTVWYEFTAPASGGVKIRTTLGTLTESQIAVYQGDCTNLTVVANSCNQDASGACSGTTENSAIELTGLTSGNSYYIRVDGEDNEVGTFDIAVIDGTSDWPSVPQQDCGSATLVCNQQTIVGDPGFLGSGSNCDYTTPYGCFSFGTQNNTVWYQIDIASNGTLLFDIVPNLSSTDYDWALIEVTGNATACDEIAAGTLSPIRCNYTATSGTTGVRTGYTETSVGASGDIFCSPVSVTSGDAYQLLIWNWSGNNTGFTLDMQATSPVNYISPTSLTWSGGTSSDWFDPINWGGCDIPDCNIDVIIVNGPTNQPDIDAAGAECKSISIEAGASLTIDAGQTLMVCEDFSNIGTLDMDPTATILFNNASADHELDGSLTGANALGNLTVNKVGGSVTFLQDVEIKGDLTTANATSIINTNGKTITLGGNFIPWDLTYTGIGSTGSLIFNGTSQQNFNPGGLIVLHNVTMNNTSGGVILSRNLELDAIGVLSLTNGVIDTDGRRVVINNTSASALNSGNSNSYINGDLRRYIASNTENYSFPIGTTTAYRLAVIANNNMTGLSYIDANFLSTFTNTGSLNTSNAQDSGTPYESIATEGIWQLDPDIQPTGGSYAISIYFDGGGVNAFAGLSDNQFGPLKRSSASTLASDWTAVGGTLNAADAAGRTVASGYAKRTGWTSFSHIALAKSSVPLPITLKYIEAKCADTDVYINWGTIQEINNKEFTVMKSTDAKYFYEIGKIDGAGNSSETIHYTFADKFGSIDENVYYKLVQTDFDGQSSESQIVTTNCSQSSTDNFVEIINSLDSETIDIHYLTDSEKKSYISVIDNLGRILYSDEVNATNDKLYQINKKQFAPGMYTIVVNIYESSIVEQFIITK